MTTVVQRIIYDHPTVMRGLGPLMRIDRLFAFGCIMRITQGLIFTIRIDIRSYAFRTHIQHLKSCGIYIAINDDHAFSGCLNNLFQQHSRLKELTFKENLFSVRTKKSIFSLWSRSSLSIAENFLSMRSSTANRR